MALRWFTSVYNPTFEMFQAWMRGSPDGNAHDLFNDASGGCEDFDLMVCLTGDEFEELLLDPTETITSAARQFVCGLLEQRATTRGGLQLSEAELKHWADGELAAPGAADPSAEGLQMLRDAAERLLAKRR